MKLLLEWLLHLRKRGWVVIVADGSQPTIRILPKRGSEVTTLDEGKADNVAEDGGRKENKKNRA